MFNKKRSIVVIIAVFAVFLYAHTFRYEIQAQESLVVPDTATLENGSNQTAPEILALLEDLKKARLDESIFSDPMFLSLQDTSVELNQEQKGRPNPFAPLGKDAVFEEDLGFATSSPRNIPFSSETASTTTKSNKIFK